MLYQDSLFFHFRPKFGKVITLLDKHQFLDAIDKENPSVIVVVHLYSEVLLYPVFSFIVETVGKKEKMGNPENSLDKADTCTIWC